MALTQRKMRRLRRAESGQGMVEALLAIPALLALAAMTFQLFFLAAAQIQLQYAAFCAARIGAVRGPTAIGEMKAAASRILASGIGFAPLLPGACCVEVLNPREGEDNQEARKPKVSTARGWLRVQVRWNYPLMVPMIGQVLGWHKGASVPGSGPTLNLRASWSMPMWAAQSAWE